MKTKVFLKVNGVTRIVKKNDNVPVRGSTFKTLPDLIEVRGFRAGARFTGEPNQLSSENAKLNRL